MYVINRFGSQKDKFNYIVNGISQTVYKDVAKDKSVIISYLKRYKRKVLEHDICLKIMNSGDILDIDSISVNDDDKHTVIECIDILIEKIMLYNGDKSLLLCVESTEKEGLLGIYNKKSLEIKKFDDYFKLPHRVRLIFNADTYQTALEKLKAKRRMKYLERVLSRHALEDAEEFQEFKV